ncbi:hypothetical protein PsYK624_122270 [Phanerochaete sordida]|uniref:Uncharacterized protein n=1 Tax=Phanerochaete sordida TaxID=48140 RepID=A0A9P3GM92_9APHY|nr:hypothetical protein PsYK624_122270 [Phanerochaete sordida]
MFVNAPVLFQGWSFTNKLECLVLSQKNGPRNPATDLYTLLESVLRLHKLSLNKILPTIPSPLPTLTFLALTMLDLRDTPSRVALFLDGIRTPSLRDVRIHCEREPTGSGTALPALGHALAARLCDAADVPALTACRYVEYDNEWPAHVWLELKTSEEEAEARRLQLTFCYPDLGEARLVSSCLSALPLGGVTQAELGICSSEARVMPTIAHPRNDYVAFRTAFGGMHALEDILVHVYATVSPKDHILGIDSLPRLFPSLKSLKLDGDPSLARQIDLKARYF